MITKRQLASVAKQLYTNKLQVIRPPDMVPAFQILDLEGKLIGEEPTDLGEDKCRKIFKDMLTLTILDKVMYEAQRQGRISFYMTSTGEEATGVGSAAGLHNDDWVYGQYRETGVLLYRGYPIQAIMNQCFGNAKDTQKARQMPVHYGSKEHRFVTISSPLGTQIPQAAGHAYAEKLKNNTGNVVCCYFGEGAASEGDFHAGLNIAAVTRSPVIFFCRNNHYAISTHVSKQYRGDGIVARAAGYGIPGLRVDGNDALACYIATRKAREIAIKENTPVLLEAMTYRVGHHSTSDDSSAYRDKKEVDEWVKGNNPITRFRAYLKSKSWDFNEDKFIKDTKAHILKSMEQAELQLKPPINEMFEDVYDSVPRHLQEQRDELKRAIEEHPEHFPTLKKHLPWKD